MEANYANTYWSGKGKHETLKDELQPLIPAADAVPNADTNPALEKFRVASNCYYDLYNNGLCNRAAEFRKVFGFSAVKLMKRHRGLGWALTQEVIDRTETGMDAIILAAYAEQFIARTPPQLDLYETAKRFRNAVAQVDFSSISGAYDSIPWADMDKVLSEN